MNLTFINLMWIVFTLPLLTWYTSTVAMHYSISKWIYEDDHRVVRNFYEGFRQFFKKTWGLGCVSGIIGAILTTNFFFWGTQQTKLAFFFVMGMIPLILFYLFLHFFVFVIIADDRKASVKNWLGSAFGFVLSHPIATFFCFISGLLLLGVFWKLPTLMLTFGASVFALICNSICKKTISGWTDGSVQKGAP